MSSRNVTDRTNLFTRYWTMFRCLTYPRGSLKGTMLPQHHGGGDRRSRQGGRGKSRTSAFGFGVFACMSLCVVALVYEIHLLASKPAVAPAATEDRSEMESRIRKEVRHKTTVDRNAWIAPVSTWLGSCLWSRRSWHRLPVSKLWSLSNRR